MGNCQGKEEARVHQARLAAQRSAKQSSGASGTNASGGSKSAGKGGRGSGGGGASGKGGGGSGGKAAAAPRRTVPEKVFLERYKVHEKVGSGTFAAVHRCSDRRTGAIRAVKIIPKHMQKGRFLASFHREMDILEMVNHPYVIRLLDAYETTDKIYLVTDFLEGGDLLQLLMDNKRLTEVEARSVIQKVLWSLDYLHHAGVLHRDLKPENILLGANGLLDLKLCDFGHSALGENKADGFGTYDYLAPEVILSEPATAASDMWSVGVLSYVVLSGTFAFCANDEQQMYKEIISGDYALDGPEWNEVSAEAKSFVSALMNVNKAERLTAGAALRHPWIIDHNDDDLWAEASAGDPPGRSPRGGGSRDNNGNDDRRRGQHPDDFGENRSEHFENDSWSRDSGRWSSPGRSRSRFSDTDDDDYGHAYSPRRAQSPTYEYSDGGGGYGGRW